MPGSIPWVLLRAIHHRAGALPAGRHLRHGHEA
nr:MAG TPA: hypothetical protein [Caudoviricetes sp.]